MNALWNDRKITAFVREVLGCKCPDEVFEKIEVSRVENRDLSLTITRIDIGSTLLVYVVFPMSNEQLLQALAELVFVGRSDRDQHDLNRFRLVIADHSDSSDLDLTKRRFYEVAGEDNKLHIHFVRATDIDGLTSCFPAR
ncbi:MAG: hypothetical protein P8163_11050 [Candidatus Thiodiazotropha sp.]